MWEGFVEKVDFEPGVKEWRSDGWWERGWWERRVDKWMRRWIEMRLVQGWRDESGGWFQRRGDAYLNERSVIFKEEMVGGRERVATDEERVLRGGWREVRLWKLKIASLSDCKNFVSEREVYIRCVRVDLWPVEKYENGSDMCGFKSLNNITSKRVESVGAG